MLGEDVLAVSVARERLLRAPAPQLLLAAVRGSDLAGNLRTTVSKLRLTFFNDR